MALSALCAGDVLPQQCKQLWGAQDSFAGKLGSQADGHSLLKCSQLMLKMYLPKLQGM